MATKTVVCPECGAATAPGRYACAACGALLAAVGPAPRGAGAVGIAGNDDLARDSEPGTATGSGVAEVAVGAEAPAVADSADPDGLVPESQLEAEPLIDAAVAPPDDPDARSADAAGPFDEDAPLAAASRSTRQPDVLHDLPEASSPEKAPITAAVPASAPAAIAGATGPSWPPPGDRGPIPAPEPRTPAGAYLPPSAVLPPLDGAVGAGAMALPAANQAVRGAPGSVPTGSSLAARSSAALADALGSVRVTADAARRAVAVGAGLAALGMLLPWVNTLPGASPLANYLDRWGLAGPGVWLVLIGLVVLAAVAASSGRTASWPVGLPAIVMAAFLAGLVWPYAVGGFGRSIGTWIVIVGAVVLLVGGLLDRRGRHERGDATV